jgi:phage FluMu gp28-like protein
VSEIFYPYQQRWINAESRFKAGMFARQTGKTFTTTFELTRDCQLADLDGARKRWVILSRGERQAKEAIEEGVKRHCQALGAIIKSSEIEQRTPGASYRALEVEWPNGARISALPANPDTARGFSASVFLDEFAFHQDSRKIWQALFPVISAGHNLRVVSTPNGKGNKFYELMTSDDPVWYRQTTDIYQAVADGLPRDIEQLRRALADEDAWSQEFELHWLDEAGAWLSFELISSCEDAAAGSPANYQGGPCYVGVDIGARGDLFVIWVDELVGDVYWCREIIAKKRISFAEQDQLLSEVFDSYNVIRCCMDQTGMGEKPVEDAQHRYGSRVEGVIFSAATKLTMATLGKEQFEDRRCRIPLGDQVLRTDLHKLQKVIGPTGTPRFVAERDGGGHADRTWAKFLAATAAHNQPGEFYYESVAKHESFGAARGMW